MNKSTKGIYDYINSWYTQNSSINIFKQIPIFVEIYEELLNWYDGDPWCALPKESEYQVRLFYNHVFQLRSSLGLKNYTIITIDEWYLRNKLIWDDSFSLNYATFQELFEYIKYFYNEAKEKLAYRLKNIEISFETQEIYNYYKYKYEGLPENVSYEYSDPRLSDITYLNDIEEKLKDKNALFYTYKNK